MITCIHIIKYWYNKFACFCQNFFISQCIVYEQNYFIVNEINFVCALFTWKYLIHSGVIAHCQSQLSRVCNTRMNLLKLVYEQVQTKSVVKKKIHLHVCTFTSFSCEITPYMDERNFWIFQAVTFIIFAVSYSLVRVRQKKLDGQLMDKINRQIASGI